MNATDRRPTTDPRVPARERCVLRYALEHYAERCPEKPYCVFDDGAIWTYAQLLAGVRRCAAGLQRLGLRQGEQLVCWLANGPQALLTYFAANYLGAVFVPFNTAYRGQVLAHVLENADARIAVVQGEFTGRLGEVDTGRLQRLVTVGPAAADIPGLERFDFAALEAEATPAPPEHAIEPWDTQAIVYTSGTTGPAKGVLMSYLHLYSNAGPESWPFVTGDDRFLVNMPMYHIGGMGLPFVMLVRGGSIALWSQFKTEQFWPFVRASQTTAVFLLGVMAAFLLKQPPSAAERDHRVEKAILVPLADHGPAVRQRFGVDVYTIFNMTEISSPIVSAPNPEPAGTCGRQRGGVEVRLVDDHDCEVATGEVGEMILRTDRPWAMTHGYYKNAEATAAAWRNGWFHTGDAFRRDADGNYFFVDRKKDYIRRRGENISSFDVENAVMAHPQVREAAAIGVPSAFGEEDVMVVVAPAAGAVIDPDALIDFLQERLPYFMVPRYLRTVDELPKTPTAKVRKVALRAAGCTPDTWDRETAGQDIGRERLGANPLA